MADRTTQDATRHRPALPSTPALRVLYLHQEGAAPLGPLPPVALHAAVTPIGREVPPGGISLAQDPRASRTHAHVHRASGGALRVADAGSRNGTFVNGRRVEDAPLRPGDVVRIGDSYLLACQLPAPGPGEDEPGELLGTAPAMVALRRTLRLVGPAKATVLLLGESGAGKEVAARALHRLSGRRGPFMAVNCSAIPESLAESQLFGHVTGAFTGAAAHPGFFRGAHGGTLFLDEVGELSPAMQPRLLRVLEEHAVTPVGAVAPVRVDVRLLAATNRDLSQSVAAGTFRGDLYARLAEFVVALPPLRERREDILLLMRHALGPQAPPLGPDLVEALLLHAWPFNVREVFKLATELRIRGAGAAELTPEMLAARLPVSAPAPRGADPVPTPRGVDRPPPAPAELRALLHANRGVVAGVAKDLGRSRRQVYRWLEQHQIDPAEFRGTRPGCT